MKPIFVKLILAEIIKIAAEQLKTHGSFKLAGALKMKLKNKFRPGRNQPLNHVRVFPMKKLKDMIQ